MLKHTERTKSAQTHRKDKKCPNTQKGHKDPYNERDLMPWQNSVQRAWFTAKSVQWLCLVQRAWFTANAVQWLCLVQRVWFTANPVLGSV